MSEAELRDEWGTPDREYKIICGIWGLTPTLDVCADAGNTKSTEYFTKEDDALRQTWRPGNNVAWMNCPYSQPLMTRFIEKAIFESTSGGIAVVFLLPDNIDHEWFDLIMPFKHKVWRDPEQKPGIKTHRIKFEPPAGVKANSPRNGSIHGVIDVWGRFV